MTPDDTTKVLHGIERIEGRLSDGAQRFDDLDTKIEEQDVRWGRRFTRVEKQRNGLILLFIMAMVITAFSLGYAYNSGNSLDDQIDANREQGDTFQQVACANARSTASAFREPSPGESRPHFLRRMFNQRETLLTVEGLDCPDIDGFFNFELQRLTALKELEEILSKSPAFRATQKQREDREDRSTKEGDRPDGGDPDSPDRPGSRPGESPDRPDTGRPDRPDPDRPTPDTPDPDPDPDPGQPDPEPPTVNPPANPPTETPPAEEDAGLIDGILDQTTNLVCQISPLGIKVCTPR